MGAAGAVCSEGRELAIRLSVFRREVHKARPAERGQLKHDEGHLFDIQGARAESGDTCLLVSSGYLQRYALVRNEYPESERHTRQEAYRLVSGQPDFDRTPFQARGEFALPRSRGSSEKGGRWAPLAASQSAAPAGGHRRIRAGCRRSPRRPCRRGCRTARLLRHAGKSAKGEDSRRLLESGRQLSVESGRDGRAGGAGRPGRATAVLHRVEWGRAGHPPAAGARRKAGRGEGRLPVSRPL